MRGTMFKIDRQTEPRPGRRPVATRGWQRRARTTALAVLVVLALGFAGAAWYVSEEIGNEMISQPHTITYDTDVLAIDAETIELGLPDEASVTADEDAVMGLRWATGYGQVGPATATGEGREVRPFRLLAGELPPLGEDVADFDSFAFPPDPTLLGPEVQTVSYPSDSGELEAWYLPGEGSTWIVAVHGIGSDRPEFLRLADAVRELRYPLLIVGYRGDPGLPEPGDSRLLVGQEEWRDVAAAVDHALSSGARDVVVVGHSFGGALALSYALEEERDVVRGLVLEAPLADFREAISLKSGEALPVGGPLADAILGGGRLFTSLRTGLDFDTVDYVDRAVELDVPILLFHGADDARLPLAISQNLAAARPDLVEFHEVEDGYHVRAWNEDPEGYVELVGRFLERIGRS